MCYLTCHPLGTFNAQTWQREGTGTKKGTVGCLNVTSTEGNKRTSDQSDVYTTVKPTLQQLGGSR